MTTLDGILTRIDLDLERNIAPWQGDQTYPMDKAERTARRLTKKAEKAAPLFAAVGLIEPVSPQAVKERYDRNNQYYADQIITASQKMAENAKSLARQVAQLVDAHRLAEFESYRVRTYPRRAEYDCEYWRKIIEEYTHDKP